jgi:arginyl-tRNA synthetase
MTFNPEESIDFNGNTGPFIQYTHARICSVFRKAEEMCVSNTGKIPADLSISDKEKSILKLLHEFPSVIVESAKNYSPAIIANFVFELAKEYNQFYHDYPILKEELEYLRNFRLQLSKVTGSVIYRAMGLLGIVVPERM